ncbi:hypothetical protein ACMFMG_009036 [Clarireedia jacksonii]
MFLKETMPARPMELDIQRVAAYTKALSMVMNMQLPATTKICPKFSGSTCALEFPGIRFSQACSIIFLAWGSKRSGRSLLGAPSSKRQVIEPKIYPIRRFSNRDFNGHLSLDCPVGAFEPKSLGGSQTAPVLK